MFDIRLKFAKAVGITALLISVCISAPYSNYEQDMQQPDGSWVPTIMNGDEYYARFESLDGYTLTRDGDGWLCYASLSSDGNTLIPGDRYTGTTRRGRSAGDKHIEISTEAIIEHVSKQQELLGYTPQPTRQTRGSIASVPRYQVIGEKRGLTILVDFSDYPRNTDPSQIEGMLNGPSESTEHATTVRSFFNKVSGGKLDYTNDVQGFYRANNSFSYYNDINTPHGVRAKELIRDLLDSLEAENYDFTQLANSGGVISAINVFYTGKAGVWAKGMWPHMSSGINWTSAKTGISANSYQVTSIPADRGQIRTFCHENGHMLLNLPDLYPYQNNGNWVGAYDLMGNASDNYFPIPPNPYFRWYNGWVETKDITDMVGGTITLNTNEDADTVVLYRNPNDLQQFMVIDAVEKKGQWGRVGTITGGLMCWIIDAGQNRWDANRYTTKPHLRLAGYSEGTFPLSIMNVDGLALGATTRIPATWRDGLASDLTIYNVSDIYDGTIFFDLDINGDPDKLKLTASGGEFGTVAFSPNQTRFNVGETVELTGVSTNPLYVFSHWSGDISGTENPITVTMDQNKTVEANFKIINDGATFSITTSAENGRLVLNPQKDLYERGELVEINAIADNGWYGAGMGGDFFSMERIDTVQIVDRDLHIEGYFHENPLKTSEFYGYCGGNRAQNPSFRVMWSPLITGNAAVQNYTSLRSADGMNVQYSVPQQDTLESFLELRHWLNGGSTNDVDFPNVTHLRVTYQSEKPIVVNFLRPRTGMMPEMFAVDTLPACSTLQTFNLNMTEFDALLPERSELYSSVSLVPLVDHANEEYSGYFWVNNFYWVGLGDTPVEAGDVVSTNSSTVAVHKLNISSGYNRELNLTLPNAGAYSLNIIGLNGRVLFKSNISVSQAGNYSVALPKAGIAKGIFIVNLQSKTGSVAKRIVIQ